MKKCVTDDRKCRQAIIINCVLDADKWRQKTSLKFDVKETPSSGAMKVDKVDIKRTTKSRQKGRQKVAKKDDHCVDYNLCV